MTKTTPHPMVSPRTLFEAGVSAAALLDGVNRMEVYRWRYRDADGDFAEGFRAYTLSTHERD